MIVLGLTGSIGMGKSTTAQMFREAGVPVWDADAAVHQLYAEGGAAVAPIGQSFPGAVRNGVVDRAALSELLKTDAAAWKRLEAIVHPLTRASQQAFLRKHLDAGAKTVVLDIPLLMETGQDNFMDAVVVVSAPAEVQRARVLARPGMTAQRFEAILGKQTPDAEKRRRADFVINTALGLDEARRQVRAVLAAIAEDAPLEAKAGAA
jgi:dephospho-CoA kinase